MTPLVIVRSTLSPLPAPPVVATFNLVPLASPSAVFYPDPPLVITTLVGVLTPSPLVNK